MEQVQSIKKREHKITITNRNKIAVSGVIKVNNSGETALSMDTSSGVLLITGQNLHIIKLSVEEGLLEAEGDVIAFKYMEAREKTSLIKKIFK